MADRPRRVRSVVGIGGADTARLTRALSDAPVEKWQLIDHVQCNPYGRAASDHRRATELLWTLPTGRYPDLPHVLAAAARTARGHPRHDAPESSID